MYESKDRQNELKCPNIFVNVIFNRIKNSIVQPFLNDEDEKSTKSNINEFVSTLFKYLTKAIDNFDKFIIFNSFFNTSTNIAQTHQKTIFLNESISELIENIINLLSENPSIIEKIVTNVEVTASFFNQICPFNKYTKKCLRYDVFKKPNLLDIIYSNVCNIL